MFAATVEDCCFDLAFMRAGLLASHKVENLLCPLMTDVHPRLQQLLRSVALISLLCELAFVASHKLEEFGTQL